MKLSKNAINCVKTYLEESEYNGAGEDDCTVSFEDFVEYAKMSIEIDEEGEDELDWKEALKTVTKEAYDTITSKYN